MVGIPLPPFLTVKWSALLSPAQCPVQPTSLTVPGHLLLQCLLLEHCTLLLLLEEDGLTAAQPCLRFLLLPLSSAAGSHSPLTRCPMPRAPAYIIICPPGITGDQRCVD